MKHKFLVAAGLLCLGTSPAFAFSIPAMAPDMAKAVKDVWAQQWSSEKPSPFDTGEAWGPVTPAKSSSDVAVVEKASLDLPIKADDGMAKSNELAAKSDDFAAKSEDLGAKLSNAAYDMGPSEPVMKPTTTPAAPAYPPCSRSASDDHCIQLYEPGVRAQLAEWNRSASGSETAMGGPYEPVDSTLAGEMGGTSMPAGAQYTGTGGPLETSDYPPCSRTVTDRCIQLYERGVHR